MLTSEDSFIVLIITGFLLLATVVIIAKLYFQSWPMSVEKELVLTGVIFFIGTVISFIWYLALKYNWL